MRHIIISTTQSVISPNSAYKLHIDLYDFNSFLDDFIHIFNTRFNFYSSLTLSAIYIVISSPVFHLVFTLWTYDFYCFHLINSLVIVHLSSTRVEYRGIPRQGGNREKEKHWTESNCPGAPRNRRHGQRGSSRKELMSRYIHHFP